MLATELEDRFAAVVIGNGGLPDAGLLSRMPSLFNASIPSASVVFEAMTAICVPRANAATTNSRA